MAQQFEGESRPAQIPVTIEDRNALKGQYIRHVDENPIYKIVEVGDEGVTAYLAEHFGGPLIHNSTEFLITWPSLKYKHRIMVHVADVDVKQHHQL